MRVIRHSKVRLLLAIAIAPLPQRAKRIALTRLLGAKVAQSATIGLSVVDADVLQMGPRSRIGHFTVLRGLRLASLGPGSTVGNFNWISAAPAFRSQPMGVPDHGRFILGRESAVTSRHYIDCSGGVTVGEFTTVAGVRSTILSHQIDLAEGLQSATTTRIGDFCFISSNVCVTPGASIPDRSVVAMGGVVVGDLAPAGALFGGVPARVLRQNVDTGRYFGRTRGIVGLGADGEAAGGGTAERLPRHGP